VPNFIESEWKVGAILLSRVFQPGGGGHLGKWRRTVGVEFFGLSMSISVCVPNFVKIG
jgi:hypothetical protein